MKFLTVEEILFLHFKIIQDFGGSHGVRDEGRLASAVVAPEQEVFGQALYPTVYDKAAVYIRATIGDHPFADGNKRTAITSGVIFLQRNGRTLTAAPKELEDFAVAVAVERYDIPHIAAWLKAHSAKQ